MKALLALAIFMFASGQLRAHDPQQDCVEQAFEYALQYCHRIYNRKASDLNTCQLGVAHTFEALLTTNPVSNAEICKPYFMGSCDSGRKIMLAKEFEYCKDK